MDKKDRLAKLQDITETEYRCEEHLEGDIKTMDIELT